MTDGFSSLCKASNVPKSVIGRNQESIFFCSASENFKIGRLLHTVVADMNRVVGGG
jgi:hypothetical protein